MTFFEQRLLSMGVICVLVYFVFFNIYTSSLYAYPPPTDPACDSTSTFCNLASTLGLMAGGTAYGRGASAVDIDNDGDIDIFQVDSGSKRSDHPYQSRIHLNNGDGTFSTTDPSVFGIDSNHLLSNWQALFFDSDNDGDGDLLLVNGGYNDDPEQLFFYQNDISTSGLFTEQTTSAGFTDEPELYWGATAADFDNDGLLDVVISARNFFQYEAENPGMVPGNLENAVLLYRNLGNNEFEEISETTNLPNPVGDNKNPVVFDFNNDGWMDILFSKWEHDTSRFPYLNEGVKLFKNEGNGSSFTEVTLPLVDEILTGETHPEYLAFAAAAFDYNQDGWQDIYLGRWSMQDYVLVNNGDETFTKLGNTIGLDAMIGNGTPYENTMGLTIYDIFNNDGYPDIVIGPGNPVLAGLPLVYCHQGENLTFDRCSNDFETGHGIARNHGVCMADFDEDGDIDIFWNLGGFAGYGDGELDENGDPFWHPTDEYPAYYVNQSSDGVTYPKAFIKLIGYTSNKDAVGAKVRYTYPNTSGGIDTHYIWRQSADGFMSQNSNWLPISMGNATPDVSVTIEIEWPSGLVSQNVSVQAGDRVAIHEPTMQQFEFVLEGLYDVATASMQPPVWNTVSLNQPFNRPPWNYPRTESVQEMPDNIVSWVLIEARAANDINLSIDARAGLLTTEGKVLDPSTRNLAPGLHFENLIPDSSYYYIIRHHNHLAVISDVPLVYSRDYEIDFRTPSSPDVPTAQLKLIDSDTYSLLAGDIDANGTITVDDFNIFQCQSAMFGQNLAADINMDGTVSVSDFNLYLVNVSKIAALPVRYSSGIVLPICP